VLGAINLVFDDAKEFDGSDAVIADTKIKKQKKAKQILLMLTRSQFFDGLTRNKTLKQAKCVTREETHAPWKILRPKDKSGAKLSVDMIDILPTLKADGAKCVRCSEEVPRSKDVQRSLRDLLTASSLAKLNHQTQNLAQGK
jgi:hypothetical protein